MLAGMLVWVQNWAEIKADDTAVLRAIKRAGRGPLPARIERYTLRLSGLGIELWSAASQERRP